MGWTLICFHCLSSKDQLESYSCRKHSIKSPVGSVLSLLLTSQSPCLFIHSTVVYQAHTMCLSLCLVYNGEPICVILPSRSFDFLSCSFGTITFSHSVVYLFLYFHVYKCLKGRRCATKVVINKVFLMKLSSERNMTSHF